MAALRTLWAFRGFILGSVQREFQSKYRNSLLGVAWTVINPLAMVTVYTVIFSQVMRARLPAVEGSFAYSIYLCAGLLTWGLFTEIVTRAQNVFLDNANLLKKLNFPRLCLPLIVVLSALINFGILLLVFLGFLLIVGQFPGGRLWALLPALAVQTFLSIGLGVTLGVLNVFFRDVGQFSGIALSFWFWCTPIVYPASILPESIAQLMAFNPMAVLAGIYQRLFLGGEMDLLPLASVLVLALLFCVLGLALFRRHAGDMADEL
ncbi:MAG: ABC transporter permease [Candidatus Accumulibacter sp.]|jgi:lipopolysaccharide transport system permease protein|nr:ABC transporter permease [Accumulibacter sp.]